MVYYKRKRTYKHRNNATRKLNNRQKRQVKRIVGVGREKKYHAYAAASTVGATPIIGLLTDIAQGVTDLTRIGYAVRLVMAEMRLVITISDPANLIRLILFRWTDYSSPSSIPGVADVLNNTGFTFTSPPNVDNVRANRLFIMHDRLYSLAVGVNDQQLIKRKFYGKKLGRKKIAWTGNSSAAANHMYFMIVSDSAAVTHPSFDINVYTYYTDS